VGGAPGGASMVAERQARLSRPKGTDIAGIQVALYTLVKAEWTEACR
jgi:hypothetical protein